MSTIQNLKNFIRHGKQARVANDQPTTNVSPIHAQQQRHNQYASPPPPQHYGISEPNVLDHKPLQQAAQPHGDYSAAVIDNRNVAAQAGDAAARAAGDAHKKQAAHDRAQQAAKQKGEEYDPTVIERIVAEERESKGKLPRYPGLERWTLIEKMGDGAFSNVYRARDNNGQYDEVAIKVVRKFEMNSSQVSWAYRRPKRVAFLRMPHVHCTFPFPDFSLLRLLHRRLHFLDHNQPVLGRHASGLQEGAEDSGGAHISNTLHVRVCLVVLLHVPFRFPHKWFWVGTEADKYLREQISSRKFRSCDNWTTRTSSNSSTSPK